MKPAHIRTLTQGTKSVINKDFFGIYQITNKDIAGSSIKSKLQVDKISSKYKPLLQARNCTANQEVDHDVGFGRIRYDGDNKPKSHGQYEKGNDQVMYDTIDIKQRFVPADTNPVEIEEASSIEISVDDTINSETETIYGETKRIVDINPERDLREILNLFHDPNAHKKLERYANKPPMTFYFESSPSNDSTCSSGEPLNNPDRDRPTPEYKLSGRQLDSSELDEIIAEAPTNERAKATLSYDPKTDVLPLEDLDEESEEYFVRSEQESRAEKFDESIEEKYAPKADKQPTNALSYLKQIRSGRAEPKDERLRSRLKDDSSYPIRSKLILDSHGFANYSQQVPDWDKCRRVDILNHLKSSILYHNYDVLAVNKPYGLASHSDSKKELLDMNALMQELAIKLRVEKVYLAHRLDKTTTGVLLFATSQERADHLNKLFKSDQVKKTYWCITRGVPDPPSAIIDIPVAEYTVAGKTRSCLAPERVDKARQMAKRYREARRAITEYHVLHSHKQVSLVEVKPRTGVKHQIRCHLGFGLNRPILGDHKYSHLGKIAPQTLPMPVLNLLQLRQSKVRTLPVHLHAKTIVLPGVKANGQTLFIEAPLPQHFKDNLKTLKLLTRDVLQDMD